MISCYLSCNMSISEQKRTQYILKKINQRPSIAANCNSPDLQIVNSGETGLGLEVATSARRIVMTDDTIQGLSLFQEPVRVLAHKRNYLFCYHVMHIYCIDVKRQ